jgi:hypothetical protein
VCAALGDRERGRPLAELLVPYAERNVLTDRSWAAWGAAARPLGRLLALTGDHGGAAREFDRAVALHRRWGTRPWLAHALLDRAEALGDEAALDEGLTLASQLGIARAGQRPSSVNDAQ